MGDKKDRKINRIKTLRVEKGYTQRELAEKLGVTTRNVQKYEAGEITPPIKRAKKIANLFNTSIEKVFLE